MANTTSPSLITRTSPTNLVQPPVWQPTPPLRAGIEMAALKPFHSNCVWRGSVAANGMGPGSPVMVATGQGTFTPIMDGAWLVGDFVQDQFLDGKVVITWKAHYVAGWDPRSQEYKITYVDNNGSAALMHGHIAGDQFVVETFPGAPVQLRLTWTLQGAEKVMWRNECSVNGSPWFLIEEYLCTNV